MLTAKTILDDFQRLGSRGNDAMSQMLQLRRQNPEALVDLVIGAMDRSLSYFTSVIGAALDLMTDASFDRVAGVAWRKVADPECWNDVLEAVLDQATLQSPRIFAGDRERLLELAHGQHGSQRYRKLHAKAAWRALDAATVSVWRRQLEGEQDCTGIARERAMALLYSHQPDAVHYAWQRLFPDAGEEAAFWLADAGYTLEAGVLRALYSGQPFHIGFSQEQRKRMQQDMPDWKREIQAAHPTWRAQGAERISGQFGGVLPHHCGLCHQPLQRLLALPQPEKAGIASRTALTFGTCLSCLGWESDGPLFYRHDAEGNPYPHPSRQRSVAVTPQFPEAALREAEVRLFAAPARWNRQDWGSSNNRQNLHRVGGAPSWIQDAEYPVCPDCNRSMFFAMQLDSCLPKTDGGELLWGSGGINYSYWCADCRISAHLWQCT